ncbi:MAG: hypothetical protein IPM71_16145 [Bacteroidota bacterium]|nr:MAG: hypothetical protein IPM71_16145 [Bacteroidota bacterium]
MKKIAIIYFILIGFSCSCDNETKNKVQDINSSLTENASKQDKKDESINQNNDEIPSIKELNEFKRYADSIGLKKSSDFISYFKIYCKIYDQFGNTKNIFIKRYLDEYTLKLSYLNASYRELLDIEKFVNDSIKTEEKRAFYYFSLIRFANYEGEIFTVLRYDSIINSYYSDYRTNKYIEDIELVKRIYKKNQDLKNGDSQVDYIYWQLGNNYFELFKKVGKEGEVMIDMTYPFSYYDSLLSLYPNSKYADDVLFKKLDYNESGSHEGGSNSANLYYIEKYSEILSRYPDTQLKPRILEKFCLLYFSYECEPIEKKRYLELSKKFGEQLIQEYPDFDNIERIIKILNDIDISLTMPSG